jgi:hypothetical protein
MRAAWRPSPHRLLTELFLRQFLANDLISPEGDRSQLLAVVGAAILSLSLFVSAIMSSPYVVPFVTPGLAAVLSLDDKFFYLSAGMIVTALVAAAQWDALAIDARDAAILEPLPVAASVIRRAKLSAVAILGVATGVAINACPSIVFPPLLVYNLREMGFVALLWLVTVHAALSVAASLFGYLSIIALRESMMAVLGVRWFSRVSPWTQGALIVLLGGSLLMLPAAAEGITQRGFDGWRTYAPPMWFLGAYEVASGGIIVDVPRSAMRARQAATDERMTAVYRTRQPEFPALARRAAMAIASVFIVAAMAYLWNARRVSSLASAPPPVYRRQWAGRGRLANAVLLRRAAARAGFYFAMAAMWRSSTHRLTLACAAAVGLAMATVAVSTFDPHAGSVTPRLLSVQPLLYGALLVGFRHVIRVPAELRANWGFQLAWRGQDRAFVAGVKSAALVALVVPALCLVWPLFAFVVGPQLALLHAVLGLAGAIVLLEALMVSYDKVPFTCSYLPSEKMKALAPIYAMAFVIGAYVFARLQFDALGGAATLWITLLVVFVTAHVASRTRTRRPDVQFDEVPVPFQRLGLDG